MPTNSFKKRIVVVCPSFPAPESGAEQMDRADGIRQLVRLGYEVVVLAKAVAWADTELIEQTAKEMGVRVVLVPYRYSNRTLTKRERLFKLLGKCKNPLYFDGAAYEYAEPVMREALKRELQMFKPNLVWFEYTYLWPLYSLVRKQGIPIAVRSLNFEPDHFLQEDGKSINNYIKYIFKYISELITIRTSDMLFAITPNEEARYKRLGARGTAVLPLRSLPRFSALPRPIIHEVKPLHVFYMGSSYSVAHNRAAAAFLLEEVIPLVEAHKPDAFVFHIVGAKLPSTLALAAQKAGVVYEGYVPDLSLFLQGMDIALVPSLMGAGMQQKVFEPLARGFPTITSVRAIAGYMFATGKEYMEGTDVKRFAETLFALEEVHTRRELSAAASARSQELFSENVLDAIVEDALNKI